MSADDTKTLDRQPSRGAVALVVSLVGLVTLGFLAPAGLIVALMALRQRPRGLAIAALVLSLVGIALGTVVVLRGIDRVRTADGIKALQLELLDFRGDHDRFPDEEEFRARWGRPADAWGHPFRYRAQGEGYEIRSAGRNGILDDDDDLYGGPDPK